MLRLRERIRDLPLRLHREPIEIGANVAQTSGERHGGKFLQRQGPGVRGIAQRLEMIVRGGLFRREGHVDDHDRSASRVRAGSLYFDPRRFRFPGLREISVFTATPLLREMILHGMRWTNRPRRGDALAENFFRTVALYCRELASEKLPYRLPRGESPGVRTVIEFTLQNLEDASFARVARKAGLSVRSLRRHFLAETGITWRQFLTRARLLRAMEILAGKRRNVTETAYACGFTNLSAFSKAFAQFTGEKPNAYRRARASAN